MSRKGCKNPHPPRGKLSADAVRFIRSSPRDAGYQRRLAQRFGVTQANISRVIRRGSWKEID